MKIVNNLELIQVINDIEENEFERYLIEYTFKNKYSSSLRVTRYEDELYFSILLQENIADENEDSNWIDVEVNVEKSIYELIYKTVYLNIRNEKQTNKIIKEIEKRLQDRLMEFIKSKGEKEPFDFEYERLAFLRNCK